MQLKNGTLLKDGKFEILQVLSQDAYSIHYEALFHLSDTPTISLDTSAILVNITELFFIDGCIRLKETNDVLLEPSIDAILYHTLKQKLQTESEDYYGIEHDNIISIIDVFEENNTMYEVTEYFRGQNLNDVIEDKGRLELDESLRYISQIIEPLIEFHTNGLLHLALNPNNIKVNSKNVAALVCYDASSRYADRFKQMGVRLLPILKSYIAPELFALEEDEREPSIDIYSIGAILYKCLTGITPPVTYSISSSELLYSAIAEPKMVDIIRKCTNDDASARYQSLEELSFALTEAFPQIKEYLTVDYDKEKYKFTEIPDEIIVKSKVRKRRKKSVVIPIVLSVLGFALITYALLYFFVLNKEKTPAYKYSKREYFDILNDDEIFETDGSHKIKQDNVVFTEDEFWEKAKEIHTIDAYQEYIDNYTEGKYVEQAQAFIDQLSVPRFGKLFGLKDRFNGIYDYEGWIVDNKPQGDGESTYRNGNSYVGKYAKGKRNGLGKFIWSNGDKYHGEFLDDVKNGKGNYYWGGKSSSQGDKYDGDWIKGNRTGAGLYQYANGDKYDGQWQNGLRHGKGVFSWVTGSTYEGNFYHGEKSGKGVYTVVTGYVKNCPDCVMYSGEWNSDMMNGDGKCFNKNGVVIYKGKFFNDKPVDTYPSDK